METMPKTKQFSIHSEFNIPSPEFHLRVARYYYSGNVGYEVISSGTIQFHSCSVHHFGYCVLVALLVVLDWDPFQ